jgi:hypothetical protein
MYNKVPCYSKKVLCLVNDSKDKLLVWLQRLPGTELAASLAPLLNPTSIGSLNKAAFLWLDTLRILSSDKVSKKLLVIKEIMWTIESVIEIKKHRWNWSKIRMLQDDSQAEIRKMFWIFF